jgi:hypothetical protein
MRQIAIAPLGGSRYRVTVRESGTETTHEVTVTPAAVERYAPGSSAENLLKASFEFLLQREPKEAILRRFELPVIERYFPEYPRAIGGDQGQTGV